MEMGCACGSLSALCATSCTTLRDPPAAAPLRPKRALDFPACRGPKWCGRYPSGADAADSVFGPPAGHLVGFDGEHGSDMAGGLGLLHPAPEAFKDNHAQNPCHPKDPTHIHP